MYINNITIDTSLNTTLYYLYDNDLIGNSQTGPTGPNGLSTTRIWNYNTNAINPGDFTFAVLADQIILNEFDANGNLAIDWFNTIDVLKTYPGNLIISVIDSLDPNIFNEQGCTNVTNNLNGTWTISG